MNNKTISTLISIAALSAVSHLAWAGGTDAGTPIHNKASISYSVGGTDQSVIISSPTGNSDPTLCLAASDGGASDCRTSFVVDHKVDLSVTAPGATTNVVPSASGAPTTITYTVSNDGNKSQDFSFSPSQTGGFAAASCTAVPATATLAKDATQAVAVTCTIPNDTIVANGDTSTIDLLATATGVVETTGAETPGTEDIVFADTKGTATDVGGSNTIGDSIPGGGTYVDGDRNAKHSADATYTIVTADLSIQKTSAIISDPFNGTTNPKRIPGAVIEYTITVTNADGAADATHIVISDILQGDLTYQVAPGCVAPILPAIPNLTAPNSGDPLACSESGGTVSSSSFTLPGGSGAANVVTLTFRATVN